MSNEKKTRQSDEDFLKRLLETFKVEADEHIKAISSGLLELEKKPAEEQLQRILDTIYRQAHSLKGAARAVELADVETICQALESIFKDFKYKGVTASTSVFDILQRAINTVELIISQHQKPNLTPLLKDLDMVRFAGFTMEMQVPSAHPMCKPEKKNGDLPPAETGIEATSKRRFAREGYVKLPLQPNTLDSPDSKIDTQLETKPETQEENVPEHLGTPSTIRVPANRMDTLMLQAEEMIFMKQGTQQRLHHLQEILPRFRVWQKREASLWPAFKAIAPVTEKQKREWQKITAFLQWSHTELKEIQGELERLTRSLRSDYRLFSVMIDTHLGAIRQTLMLPFASLTEGFPRMVRELARQKGKEVDLEIQGNDIEVDKRILETMKDPLLHLLRNAIDHGIEDIHTRKQLGKPQRGLVQIIITQKENNMVEILVSDDGQGILLENIKEKALALQLYTPDEWQRLSSQEQLDVIFQPEFSTSPIISDISGRGLGLAIVREATTRLGGRLSVSTDVGQRTTFRMLLRMSLATFRGILVEVARRCFIIPNLHVACVMQVRGRDIKTVENRDTVQVNGELIALAYLQQVLQLPSREEQLGVGAEQTLNLVVLDVNRQRMGFLVERVLNESEVLVKELGPQLARVRNIAGATILGSGEVVLILNPADLVQTAIQQAQAGRRPLPHPVAVKAKPAPPRKKHILVVEDSITSRMLLKNILETAGYHVSVAVDGIDGWIRLKEEKADLLVLDVEMPGLNGFELTSKIRQDNEVKHLPVVLVTSLEARADREKGIEVGADAYIIKSSFDQSNLLAVIEKLL